MEFHVGKNQTKQLIARGGLRLNLVQACDEGFGPAGHVAELADLVTVAIEKD
jgi:hypothetical protein